MPDNPKVKSESSERANNAAVADNAKADLQAESEQARTAGRLPAPGRDRNTAEPLPSGFPAVELTDGVYKHDSSGHVTAMISKDGSLRREFKYADPEHRDRVTTLIINGQTEYRFAAPIAVNGQPIEEQGHELNTFAVYQGGHFSGYWSGILDMHKKGVYSVRGFGDTNPIRHEGASGPITEAQAEARLGVRTKPFDSEAFKTAETGLLEAAKHSGIPAERFSLYMKDLVRNASTKKLTERQITATFANLCEALTAKNSPVYSAEQIKTAIETGMHNVARTMEIDQGQHPTCNVATVEIYAAVRHPDEYSRMLKEIITTGKYRTSDGQTVTPPVNALHPGEDEVAYNLDRPNDGRRNLASQIIEMTLINGLYETGRVVRNINGQNVALTDTRYVLDKAYWANAGNGLVTRVGEDRLANKLGQPTSRTASPPNLLQSEVLAASKMMLGYEMPYVAAPWTLDGGRTWNHVFPNAEMLMKSKRENKLPLGITTMNSAHVQTIHDVVTSKSGQPWVLLDNQHGEVNDGWITLEQLHRSQSVNYEVAPAIRRWQKPRI